MTLRQLCLLLACTLTLTACWQKDVSRSYYPSGKLQTEATVRKGILDGPAAMYYESGAKMSDAVYKTGLLHGKSTSFYENGTKKAQAHYMDGILHGLSVSWNEDGKLIEKACFNAGRVVELKNKNAAPKECSNE